MAIAGVNCSVMESVSIIGKYDKDFEKIVARVSQVALYKLDTKEKEWEKRNVEGTFYLYRRKGISKYGIFILNQLNSTHFVELLNSTMEIQLQKQCLLFKNLFKTIYSIWFNDKSEFNKATSKLKDVLFDLKQMHRPSSINDGKNRSVSKHHTDASGVTQSESINVQELFAKVSTTSSSVYGSGPMHRDTSIILASSTRSVDSSHIINSASLESTVSSDSNVTSVLEHIEPLDEDLIKKTIFMNLDSAKTSHKSTLTFQGTWPMNSSDFVRHVKPSEFVISTMHSLTSNVYSDSVETNAKCALQMTKEEKLQTLKYLFETESELIDILLKRYNEKKLEKSTVK